MIVTYSVFFIILLIVAAATILFFTKSWKSASTLRNGCINFSILGFTSAFLLLIIEIFFYLFVVHSDSFSFTLANQRWFENYWHPINQLNYRDVEHPPESLKDKKIVFVVGDSFVAGQGIKHYRDRFSNLLEEKLGNPWVIFNIAQVGWSTTEERHAILTHPQKPQVLILSYFVDDIREATNRSQVKEKFRFSELVNSPPSHLAWIIQRSYLCNFVYWQWYRYRNRQPEDIYWKRLRAFYDDESAWQVHRQELEDIGQFAKNNQITFIPLIFPNLVALSQSQPITLKVTRLFQELGFTPIDLTERLSNRNPEALIVSRIDAHPNEQLNKEVAEILFTQMQQRHLF